MLGTNKLPPYCPIFIIIIFCVDSEIYVTFVVMVTTFTFLPIILDAKVLNLLYVLYIMNLLQIRDKSIVVHIESLLKL